MNRESEIIAARREEVIGDYNSAIRANHRRFLEGDEKATENYIFPNQIIDANAIVNLYRDQGVRVVSVSKKTKVGMDGLMIEVAKLMTTHPDDTFVVNPDNVRIITGMSNAGWEKDMKEKCPNCFKEKVFHHGKLQRAHLDNLKDALIIIDEIDSGDKESQKLHDILHAAHLLDVNYIKKNNIRFMVDSATMLKQIYDLYCWGPLHEHYKMTIPPNYIGHKEFLDMGIIQEFYITTTIEEAERWIQEDIIDNYGDDYRVHIIRLNAKNANHPTTVSTACLRKGIQFRNHTSKDRLTDEEVNEFFKDPLTGHIVLGVKGFLRRANLIPNKWKLRIGASHELWTKEVDNNVQIQGLPGRLTGYWKHEIEAGHKTGPYRTSIKAVKEYEEAYNNPYCHNSYQTSGFKKNKKGKVVTAIPTLISAKNISGLNAIELPEIIDESRDICQIGPFNTINDCYKSLEVLLGRRDALKTKTVRAIDPSDETPGTEGYVVSTKLGQNNLSLNTLRKDNRIVLTRKLGGALPKMLREIAKGNSVGPSTGSPNAQNYIILAVYDSDESLQDSYKFYARYEEPMRDINNNPIFHGDKVNYKSEEYTIHAIIYSKDGVPTRATLEKNGQILTKDDKGFQVSGNELIKL